MTTLKLLRYACLIAFLSAVIAAAFFLKYNGIIVLFQAERIAKGRPYCIEYANPRNDSSFKQADSLSDLSGWSMWAALDYGGSGAPFYTTNHALLVLDRPRRVMNWSYKSENFENDVLNMNLKLDLFFYNYLLPEIDCTPVVHFWSTVRLSR